MIESNVSKVTAKKPRRDVSMLTPQDYENIRRDARLLVAHHGGLEATAKVWFETMVRVLGEEWRHD